MFQAWLAQKIERKDVIWRVEELMLRFAFHSYLEDPRATRVFLDKFLREVEGYLKELRKQLSMMLSDTPIQGRLALEAGIELYKARGRWARKALTHFAV